MKPCPGRWTFEYSMIREVLCVARRFTAGCALHRCLSRGVLHDDCFGTWAAILRWPANKRQTPGRGPRLRAAPLSLDTPWRVPIYNMLYTQQVHAHPASAPGRSAHPVKDEDTPVYSCVRSHIRRCAVCALLWTKRGAPRPAGQAGREGHPGRRTEDLSPFWGVSPARPGRESDEKTSPLPAQATR